MRPRAITSASRAEYDYVAPQTQVIATGAATPLTCAARPAPPFLGDSPAIVAAAVAAAAPPPSPVASLEDLARADSADAATLGSMCETLIDVDGLLRRADGVDDPGLTAVDIRALLAVNGRLEAELESLRASRAPDEAPADDAPPTARVLTPRSARRAARSAARSAAAARTGGSDGGASEDDDGAGLRARVAVLEDALEDTTAQLGAVAEVARTRARSTPRRAARAIREARGLSARLVDEAGDWEADVARAERDEARRCAAEAEAMAREELDQWRRAAARPRRRASSACRGRRRAAPRGRGDEPRGLRDERDRVRRGDGDEPENAASFDAATATSPGGAPKRRRRRAPAEHRSGDGDEPAAELRSGDGDEPAAELQGRRDGGDGDEPEAELRRRHPVGGGRRQRRDGDEPEAELRRRDAVGRGRRGREPVEPRGDFAATAACQWSDDDDDGEGPPGGRGRAADGRAPAAAPRRRAGGALARGARGRARAAGRALCLGGARLRGLVVSRLRLRAFRALRAGAARRRAPPLAPRRRAGRWRARVRRLRRGLRALDAARPSRRRLVAYGVAAFALRSACRSREPAPAARSSSSSARWRRRRAAARGDGRRGACARRRGRAAARAARALRVPRVRAAAAARRFAARARAAAALRAAARRTARALGRLRAGAGARAARPSSSPCPWAPRRGGDARARAARAWAGGSAPPRGGRPSRTRRRRPRRRARRRDGPPLARALGGRGDCGADALATKRSALLLKRPRGTAHQRHSRVLHNLQVAGAQAVDARAALAELLPEGVGPGAGE
ncbi:acyl-CoA oxidase [Aureococcus anophagefferens]|nr:acyl-CoA oxidase [Aureococcus anophagefferens]